MTEHIAVADESQFAVRKDAPVLVLDSKVPFLPSVLGTILDFVAKLTSFAFRVSVPVVDFSSCMRNEFQVALAVGTRNEMGFVDVLSKLFFGYVFEHLCAFWALGFGRIPL